MKAILCRTLGSPDLLTLEDVPSPPLDADQVRIRVRACGVNYPDVLMVAGKYQVQPPMPFSPGAESSGEIVEVGSNCREFRGQFERSGPRADIRSRRGCHLRSRGRQTVR